MKGLIGGLLGVCFCLLGACAKAPQDPDVTQTASTQKSGIDKSNFDLSVKPGDDFYHYVDGTWLKTTKIPAEKSSYSAFTKLADDVQLQLRGIVEEAQKKTDRVAGSDEQKVGDMFASFMNEDLANSKGVTPLQPLFDKIDAVKSRDQLPTVLAELGRAGVSTPIGGFINQDAKNPEAYILYLWQDGLGLPERDYYLDKDNPKFREIRAKYLLYMGNMLKVLGVENPSKMVSQIMGFETALAQVSWTPVDNRDDDKTYNKRELATINSATPDFDLKTFLEVTGIHDSDAVIVSQPSYFEGMAKIIANTDLPTIKAYLKWQTLNAYAAYLSKDIVDANFNFYGKTLSGAQELKPRWKRGVDVVEQSLGEVLGRIYVQRYFPEDAKARMEVLIHNLLDTYRVSIKNLTWMGDETKTKALEKLDKFNVKVGYPNKWKDYSALTVDAGDLVGNVERSREVEHNREMAKLGKPVDKDEWFMTPQTINAYYNPVANEIVFPAAILQPPFFDRDADDAVNYGAIGAVIGHEIGHGFDDQGSKYNGDGKMENWWTDSDRKNFMARTKALSEQYSHYCPLGAGQPCVNGDLTIGENIGDLGGLSISYKAYKSTLAGKEAPVLDGFTGDQRVFIGWAQAWRTLMRDELLLTRIKTDPHSPPEYRVNGVVRNIPEWYDAFDVKEGDALYLPPDQRVKIWY